mgnify:CR=1 FL=1
MFTLPIDICWYFTLHKFFFIIVEKNSAHGGWNLRNLNRKLLLKMAISRMRGRLKAFPRPKRCSRFFLSLANFEVGGKRGVGFRFKKQRSRSKARKDERPLQSSGNTSRNPVGYRWPRWKRDATSRINGLSCRRRCRREGERKREPDELRRERQPARQNVARYILRNIPILWASLLTPLRFSRPPSPSPIQRATRNADSQLSSSRISCCLLQSHGRYI